MRAVRMLFVSVAIAVVSACGSTENTGVSTEPAGSDVTVAPASTSPVSASTSPSTTVADLVPPSTLAPVTADLFDPATWIGHQYSESMMAAPFAEVSLDGVPTGWVTAGDGCGMMDGPLPPACIAFVRPDPGGDGHSLSEPGTWIVLSWQVDPTNYPAGGPVFDAVSVPIDDPTLMPEGQCRATNGDPGVYAAFIRYDASYRPAPDATAVTPDDIAAHPVVIAWTLDAGAQVVEVPAATVECILYSYGD